MIWAHPDAPQTLWERIAIWRNARTGRPSTTENNGITIMIGPEGGWSDHEQRLLKKTTPPVRLATHILRIETAATAATAIAEAAIAGNLNAGI